MYRAASICLIAASTLVFTASHAEAARRDEVVFLTFDGGAMIPASDRARRYLDPGFAGGVGIYHTWSPVIAAGLRAHGGFFTRNNPRDDASGFGLFSAALRFRPFATVADARRTTGFWFEAGMGVGLLDGPGSDLDPRFTLEAGAGYGFAAGLVGISPFFRAMHFVDPSEDDLVAVVFGIEVNLFDRRLQPPTTASRDW
ncbi:MAG: hypothetical protein R3F39_09225 [Myxococcota bacterium]